MKPAMQPLESLETSSARAFWARLVIDDAGDEAQFLDAQPAPALALVQLARRAGLEDPLQGCPDRAQLEAFARYRMPLDRATLLAAHAARCPACLAAVTPLAEQQEQKLQASLPGQFERLLAAAKRKGLLPTRQPETLRMAASVEDPDPGIRGRIVYEDDRVEIRLLVLPDGAHLLRVAAMDGGPDLATTVSISSGGAPAALQSVHREPDLWWAELPGSGPWQLKIQGASVEWQIDPENS